MRAPAIFIVTAVMLGMTAVMFMLTAVRFTMTVVDRR